MWRSSGRIVSAFAGALILALAPLGSRDAAACSCEIPGRPGHQFERADVVFFGRVVEQRMIVDYRRGGIQRSTFAATRVWKGPVNASFTLKTLTGAGSCGMQFREGVDYLIYAHHASAWEHVGPGLTTGICTGTMFAEYAADRLALLGPGTPAASICPQVADRLPPEMVSGVLDDPWRYGGYGLLADPGRPPSPYNPERTRLSLRNPHAPLSPMNAPLWKAYCP